MPTIHDKTILQAQSPSKVFLFKEGFFYKAYNQGAYLMRHKNNKVNVKKNKNSENELVSIGFPSTFFEALKYDFESYSCFDSNAVFNEAEFQNWYGDHILANLDQSKEVNQQQSSLEAIFINELVAQII